MLCCRYRSGSHASIEPKIGFQTIFLAFPNQWDAFVQALAIMCPSAYNPPRNIGHGVPLLADLRKARHDSRNAENTAPKLGP
jgi:hypothetical protein